MSKLFKVEDQDSGKRIDLFMIEQELNLTRTSVKKLIIEGLITVDRKKVKPNLRLKSGVEVAYQEKRSKEFIDASDLTKISATKMNIDIVFENEDIVIVNKANGLVVHPVYTHKDDTLLNGLTYYYQEKGEKVKVRPVHRLDKETSGIILFSKNKDSNEFYSKLFEEHIIEKTYYAVVFGDFLEFQESKSRGESYEYFSYISKDKNSNQAYYNTTKEKGLPSTTQFTFISHYKRKSEHQIYSVVKVKPMTGRTHQIRVHLSSLGFPILGDQVYSKNPFKRMMLHAYSLKLPMKDGSEKVFIAKLPKEFSS